MHETLVMRHSLMMNRGFMENDEKQTELDDDLFDMLPEGTRIIIRGNKVTFENLPPELLDVALSLNPQDTDLKARKESTTSTNKTTSE